MAEITWKSILTKLVGGDHLSAEESEWFVDDHMNGNADPAAVGAVLATQQQLGLTPDEVRGAAKAMVAHAIPLYEINGPVTFTTGRRLRDEGFPPGVDTCVVMLDGECSFRHLPPKGLQIWWAGYAGMACQITESGPLDEVCERIVARRAAARAEHGWIMDIYLLRRAPDHAKP